MKKYFWGLLIILLFAGCAEKVPDETGLAAPEIMIAQELLPYREITYGQYQQQTGQEAELLHACYYLGAIPETGLWVIFGGEYDMELGAAVLLEGNQCIRMEGRLGELLSGLTEEMTPDEFVSALAWKEGEMPGYQFEEGAGTAYYVADRYVVIDFDSDGDGEEDSRLEISLEQSEAIGPDSYAWLSLRSLLR